MHSRCTICSLSRNGMYHRITLTDLQSELHQCTKFGVNGSKFPRTGGPLANKLVRSWRAQPAPPRNGNHKNLLGWGSIHVTSTTGISRAHCLACKGGKRTTGAKYLHVHCTCTTHPSPFLHTAPSRPCQGAPMYRVWCRLAKVHPCTEFGVASSKFTFWRVQLAPHRNGTPNGF